VGGTPLALPIPPQAAFLTLATGAGNGSFNCNAGTFGGAVILGGSGTGVGPFLRGDCNQDGTNTGQVTDGVFLLNFLFLGGVSPRCLAACDFNGDGAVPGSPTDAVYYFNFNFLGGADMPEPLRACARSTRPGDIALGCADPRGCQ
jgi:hypothetical protein